MNINNITSITVIKMQIMHGFSDSDTFVARVLNCPASSLAMYTTNKFGHGRDYASIGVTTTFERTTATCTATEETQTVSTHAARKLSALRRFKGRRQPVHPIRSARAKAFLPAS